MKKLLLLLALIIGLVSCEKEIEIEPCYCRVTEVIPNHHTIGTTCGIKINALPSYQVGDCYKCAELVSYGSQPPYEIYRYSFADGSVFDLPLQEPTPRTKCDLQ